MTESTTKVRLVRCPKCENLLPELADYSVYQCGGCGAVLRAKKKPREGDALSEKSDEETVAGVPAKSPNSSDSGTVVLSDISDAEIKSNAGSSGCDQRSPESKETGLGLGPVVQSCRTQSKGRSDKWAIETEMNADELDNQIRKEQEVLSSQIGYTSGSQGSGRMSDWRAKERVEVNRFFPRTMRADIEGVQFSTSNYPDEGSSTHHSDSAYGFAGPLRNRKDLDGLDRVQHLENDRAELLRKLDELREQLSRTCDVADKPKEKVPLDGRMGPQDHFGVSSAWPPNGPSISDRTSMPLFGPDKHAAGPPFHNNRADLFPYASGHEMAVHGAYPPMRNSNQIPGYGDTFGPLRRGSDKLSGQYPYHSGQFVDASRDPYEPFRQNATFHRPSCSCYNCYQRVSAPVPPPAFGNTRFSDLPTNPVMYHPENLAVFGSHFHNAHNVRTSVPPLTVHGPQAHSRWPSDMNFENSRPGRVVASSGLRCCPVAGGAPFITCHNCFELLQLPKKAKLMSKNQKRLRCGACSTMINFKFADKKLILSADGGAKQLSSDVDDSCNEVANESSSYSHSRLNRFTANFSSDDYDSSGYDFQVLDTEPIQLSTSHGLNLSKPQEMPSFLSSSPSTSEDENCPVVLASAREVSNAAQQPLETTRSPPPAGSPLQDHFDYSVTNNAVNRLGKGNRSSRSDQEKVMPNKVATRQNSLKETAMATEMEVPFNECPNTLISQDSDAIREDSLPKMHKSGESFFANIIKKSFKDFSRSNQPEHTGKGIISINGRTIPERLIKKAEKQAGQIHPGQYWYDFRAGFWGVMGGPCLGIIPPFIEEFNYPMPQTCAGGNTRIFVNGRELHQKDLNLLASRGLPTESNRSYIIEINGRVLDEDTGEELESLGKLAPTVERVKHGFGMKIPKGMAA